MQITFDVFILKMSKFVVEDNSYIRKSMWGHFLSIFRYKQKNQQEVLFADSDPVSDECGLTAPRIILRGSAIWAWTFTHVYMYGKWITPSKKVMH